MSIALAPDPEDRDGFHVARVRHLGTIRIAARLSREDARRLTKSGMDPAVAATTFRDLVLESAVDDVKLSGLTAAARHRVALVVLRAWGAWPEWRRLYGNELAIDERMRRLLIQLLREQSRPRTIGDLRDDFEQTLVALPVQRTARALQKRLEEPRRAIQHAMDGIMAPLRQTIQRLARWFEELLKPLRRKIDAAVRSPAIRQAAVVLNRRLDLGRVDGPVANLLRVHRERWGGLDGLVHRAPVVSPSQQDRPAGEIVLPDHEMLTSFFVGERGDPAWRRRPLGWLLSVVPLSFGATIHDRLQESSEAAIAWLAERLMRHELRRVLEPALIAVQCEPETREVLLAGVDHYLRRDWSPADTLLTAGLDGLLLNLALQRGIVTEGQYLRREDGKRGSRVTTAGHTALLTRMGFDASQIAYLTSLSLGPTGNPPRHGSASPIGSDVHAAGSLLGLLLVLAWAGQERPLVARALAAA